MPTRGLINPELLTDIADAIRAKNGTSAGMTPAQMAAAISNLELSEAIKQALLNCFAHVAWIDDQGQSYYDALEDALYPTAPPAELLSISAVFEQGQTVICDTDSLDDLKPMLTVTAHYSDSTSAVVVGYTLSGTLTVGTNTFTVSYGGKSATFEATIKHNYANEVFTGWSKASSGSISLASSGITMKCTTQTQISNWNVWVADTAKTKWSEVNGKTVKLRLKARADTSTTEELVVGLSIFSSSSLTSIGGSYARRSTAKSAYFNSDSAWYETTLACDIANFTAGTLTPNANSTFGMYAYSQSLNNVYIEKVQVFEVDTE